ncbi:hypothetical protein [Chamaesiphon polymorphus]
MAIAWVLAKSPNIVPVQAQLSESLTALDVDLSAA